MDSNFKKFVPSFQCGIELISSHGMPPILLFYYVENVIYKPLYCCPICHCVDSSTLGWSVQSQYHEEHLAMYIKWGGHSLSIFNKTSMIN